MSRTEQSISPLLAPFFLVVVLSPAALAENSQDQPVKYADERIVIDHARVARPRGSHRPSLISQAATGKANAEVPQPPFGSTGANEKVQQNEEIQQVGYLESVGLGYRSDCGPVCDHVSCGAEPDCGLEVGCGLESGWGVDPGCGIEVGCGVETFGEFEVSCGLEGVLDHSCDACAPEIDSIPLFLPLLRVNWSRFDFFAGVQGFKGPMNFANTGNARDGSGSFGFYEGFNEGRSLKRLFGWDMAAQFGVRATQSNLSGASFTNDGRNQVFVTGGLFRRVDYGLQYGAVVDYLSDDWYFRGDLVQLRSELSWRAEGCHVIGFQYFAGLNDDSSIATVTDPTGAVFNSTVNFEPTDQYRVFYRQLLKQSGQWDVFAGWTNNDDALVGASMNMPLRRNIVLSTGATYLIPNEGSANLGYEQESWNIALGLIYRPGGPRGAGRYSRPMFDVADNGTFLVDRL